MRDNVIMAIAFVLALLLLLLANGCAPNERVIYQTVYQEVNVPVPCTLTPHVLGARSGDEVLDMADIAEYTHALKTALEACTGETLK